MIIYEVTCYVTADNADSFERFMIDSHIPDVLATGSFESAMLERSATGTYRTRYMASTQIALDLYFERHAHALREDFAEHMPDSIEVVRQEWTVLKHFA